MTQEDRKLLIKDLCGRSYYKVKLSVIYNDKEYEGTLCAIYPEDNRVIIDNLNKPCHYPNQTCGGFIIDEHNVKPYLFPLSSMTEGQKKEFSLITCDLNDSDYWKDGNMIYVDDKYQLNDIIDFYHKNHLDYRGLIEKGLAIDCTNLNIY